MDVIGSRTLRDLLAEKVAHLPDNIFLLFEDNKEHLCSLTYKEFSNKVIRLANAFIEFGVKKEDKVTLHLPNCLEFIIAWFALSHIGAVMVPTNILSTEEEMEYILGHSESVLLITEETYLRKFNKSKHKLPILRDIWIARYQGTEHKNNSLDTIFEAVKEGDCAVEIHSEDISAMMYTSGTTSRPKGVLITHGNYLYAGEVMSKSIRLSPEDRQLIVLPLFHANAEYYSFMSALTVGASVAITERFSASRYFKQAKRLEATVGSLFAAPIRMILKQDFDPDDRNHNLRVIWFAQSITEKLLKTFETNYNIKLLQLYGMTETIGTPLMNPIDGERNNMGIGRPVLGYEVRIVDDLGNDVPQGEVGELIVKGVPGRTLMKGYFNNPQATEETLRDGWLHTGDNIRMDNNGHYFFIDRKKDMIKRAGENIAANEIEKVISEHPCVFDCAVIGVADEIRDETIKVYVVVRDGHQLSPEEVIKFCQNRLSTYKIPEFVEFVTELPRTSVGKIQKHILRKMHEMGNF